MAAFRADPAWTWLVQDRYEDLAPLFAGALFDTRVGRQTVWMTPDASSVSLWDPPGAGDAQVAARAWEPFEEAASPADRVRVAAYDAACAEVAPDGPYWYLGVLATRPQARGRGGASAVMAAGLARADADGLPTCLETSSTANREFYARRGFTSAVPVPLAAGPPTWWLTRPSHP